MMEQWHLKKEVNFSHIISTLIIAVSGFWYLADLDKRIMTAQQDIKHIKEQRKEDAQRVEKRLDSIDQKLDKLLESRGN